MTAASPCPRCGSPSEGQFCAQCGEAVGSPAAPCGQCGATLAAGARFCHRCGRSLAPAAGGRLPWLVAGTVVIVLVMVIAFRAGAGFNLLTPDMANSGNQSSAGAPVARAPDISRMTPRERFDRLFERVMGAGARQDSAVVVDFTPMALGAYDQLETYDDLARYRAALIRLQAGEFQGASALADSILAATPNHLLGLIILGTAARFQGDSGQRRIAHQRFLENYQTELAAGLTEYNVEQAMIESFREAALADDSSD